MASIGLAVGILEMASLLIEEIEEVTSRFSCVPYPTTTTSVNSVTSGASVISMLDLEPTGCSCVMYPINEYTRIASPDDGMESEYLPSASVVVPVDVPFNRTLT